MFDAMEYLAKDPIIEFYINFSRKCPGSSINGRKLPTYSETLLRLAARHALGSTRPVEANILQLYRKLVLFYFAETHTAVDDLLNIMPCFSESELLKCFENYETIRGEWTAFTRNNLIYHIRKRAFFDILSEWTRRYMQIDGNLDSVTLRNQAFHIHSFFKWGSKGIVQWLRSFKTNTLKGNWESESNIIKEYPITHRDLRVDIIALDIKDKLHPLIITELEDILKTQSVILTKVSKVSEAIVDSENFTCSPAKRIKVDTKKSLEDEETDCLEFDNIVEVYELSGTETDGNDENEYNDDKQENEENYANDDNDGAQGSDNIESDESEDNDNNVDDISVAIEENDENDENDVIYVNDDNVDDDADGYNDDDDEVDDGFEMSEKVLYEPEAAVLNDEQATKYLSALQAYMVVNGLYDAIPLLDRVDSILRENSETAKGTIS